MTTEHEHVLAAIEQRALAMGLPVDEMDAHIADELRVPRDHYIAYLLVWGAIESYRLVHYGPIPPDGFRSRANGHEPGDARALRRIWQHAGAIHEAAINGGDIRALVREQARDLIAELLTLSERLLAPSTSTSESEEVSDRE